LKINTKDKLLSSCKSQSKRFGLHPKYYNAILGKKTIADIEKGSRFKSDFYENN